jgi:peptidoglycan hydrolase-like protein with peptidoglycan-binding domain
MPFSLIWLPAVLQAAGLKVAPTAQWEDRGRREIGEIFGVICHHTAGARNGNMPSLDLLIRGRPDLPGPLAQLGLGRDGTFYVIAAGRCNHAGEGIWQGIVNGNGNFIGIEAENTGRADDFPWPAVQMDAYRRGVAAILKHVGRSALVCAGHKEYALPKGRKSDPSFDMDQFRTGVTAILDGTAPPPVLIPPEEPATTPGGSPGKPTLRRGSRGEHVAELQRLLGLDVNGEFDGRTEAAVRVFQRTLHLVPDGIVGPKTWAAIEGMAVARVPADPHEGVGR